MDRAFDKDVETARRHIEKAERSQGPMNDGQRSKLLGMKTEWSWFRIDKILEAVRVH